MSIEAWAGFSIGLAGLCVTLLVILVGFVRDSVTTATSHGHRLTSLEDHDKKIDTVLEKMTSIVNRHDKHLYAAERLERASQGNFDNTDPPPRG